MKGIGNSELTPVAQKLRRAMTKEERHLWYDCLKLLPVPVKRQRPIGRYVVDFYIPSSCIVIELDGSQHYEEDGKKADRERDRYLTNLGLKVLRYANSDVNYRFDSVCQDIWNHLKKP